MTRQAIEVPMRLPTPQLKEMPFARSRRIKRQRRVVRNALELMAKRVPLPAVVTLIRISTALADNDRAALSMSAVRDETARWLAGVPFETLGDDGKPKTPRAPDGPSDPITWRYGQRKSKRFDVVMTKKGPKRQGYQAALIVIESGSA